VRASQLERALPGLGAGVGKEDAIQAGAFGEPLRQLSLTLVIEEIRDVDERAALLRNGFNDGWMGVAQRIDADAASTGRDSARLARR